MSSPKSPFRRSGLLVVAAFSAWLVGMVLPSRHSSTGSTAQAAVLLHPHHLKIENEDTLSEALDKHFPNRKWRLWGKKGAIARVSAMNPQIADMNKLKPGMLIDIGEYAEMGGEAETASTPPKARDLASLIETQEQEPAPSPVAVSSTPALPRADELNQDDEEDDQDEVSEEEANQRYGILSVAPEFSYSKINSVDRSTGGNAVFLSNLTPGLRLSWRQHWSDQFQTSLNFGARNEAYISAPGYSLDRPSHVLTDFGMGAAWVPFSSFDGLALDGRFSFRQELFARSTSATQTTLDPVVIPEAMLGARYRIIDWSPFALTLHAHELFLFSANTSSYTIASGKGSEYGVTITQSLSRSWQISGDFWYFTQSQSSSIATQDRTDVGMTLGITFRFEPFAKPEKLKRGDLP